MMYYSFFFFFSSRRRHTRSDRDWSSDVCSSDLVAVGMQPDVLWALAHQKVERDQQHGGDQRKRKASPAPAVARDQDLHPWQQDDRPGADAGKCDSDRQPAPSHEPV